MKIAFISGMKGYPWGGSEILWSEAARCLRSDGHDVLVSIKKWPTIPEPVRNLANEGLIVDRHERKITSRFIIYASKLFRRSTVQPGWARSWKKIIDFKPDLVCVSHGGTACGLDWMLLCLEAGIPYVSISQANSESIWPEDSKTEDLYRAHKEAIKSFFVSKSNLALFETQLGKKLPNGQVVWNPYNVPRNADPKWPSTKEFYRLACVGRLHPASKGQDLFLHVLAQKKWRERPIQVSLYGAGPCELSLRNLVSSLNLEKSVHFHGYVDNIVEVWRHHHALILPSRYEGLPLALVEAMLCGRTAIVTDVAGAIEVLNDNETGFVAAAPTIGLLDEAMERAWQRREEWQLLGQTAAKSARDKVPENPSRTFANELISIAKTIVPDSIP